MQKTIYNTLFFFSFFLFSACAGPAPLQKTTEPAPQAISPVPVSEAGSGVPGQTQAASEAATARGDVIQAGNLDRLQPLYRLGEGTFGYEMALSADGSRLAVTNSSGVILFDTKSGSRLRLIQMPSGAESVAISPDGKSLAAVYRLPNETGETDDFTPLSQMTTLGLWRVEDGSPLFTKDLRGTDCGERLAHGLAFSSDGQEIYLIESTSWRGLGAWHNLCVYSPADGRLLRARDLHPQEPGEKIMDAVISDDRQQSAVALKEAIAIHDAQGNETARLAAEVQPDVMSFSPDGQRLAFAGYDDKDRKAGWKVFVWNLNESSVTTTLTGFKEMVISIAWSPDGKRIAAGLSDGLIVWDAGGEVLFHLQPIALRVPPGEAAPGSPWDLVFSPDGKMLFGLLNTSTLGIPGEVRTWSMPGGEELWRVSDHIESPAAFSPDGKRLALGGFADGRVQVWEAGTGKRLVEWDTTQGLVNQALFSRDGEALVTAGQDGSLGVWNAQTGTRLAGWNGNKSPIMRIDISPSGDRLASVTAEGEVVVRNFPSGETVQKQRPASDGWLPTVLSFTPDGKDLLMGWNLYNQISGYRGQWILWNTETNTLRPLANTWPVAALRDGQGTHYLVWSVENGFRIGRLEGDRLTEMIAPASPKGNGVLDGFAVSPDGRLLVSGNAFGLHVWNLPSNQPVLLQSRNGGAYPYGKMMFSPDGTRLAISGSPVMLWGITP